MRKITYAESINEGFRLAMKRNEKVFQIGVGVNTPWYVGDTLIGLVDEFGETRMIDTPVSENGITGVAIGAALSGLKPILTFPRMDFMFYAFDQICNHAATLNYSLGGNSPIPLLIRAIINRKGEQAAQHSQSLHGIFMQIPGLKVLMPSTPFDAKGMILAALEDNNPIIYIDDRELYLKSGEVPEDYYTVSLDKANIAVEGSDITVVASSYLFSEAKLVVERLHRIDINPELIDLRVVKPIDTETIIRSVSKTGRLLVIDGGWNTGGLASEIIASVAMSEFIKFKCPPVKITLPDLPAPASHVLENVYYPSQEGIYTQILQMVKA